MSKNEKREKRRTRDEGIYTPRTARLRVLSCRSAPSKPAHPLSARRLLRSASLAFPVVPPAKPACPVWSKASCAAISQAPFAPAHRPRCNTLDLAGKIVCQGRPCPLWIPLPRNRPVSLDASPQRKPEHPNCAPAFSAQRGASPLDSLCKRNAVPHRSPCQRHRESVSLGVSLGENCYEPQDAHNSFPIT